MDARHMKYAGKKHDIIASSHVVENERAQTWVDKEDKASVAVEKDATNLYTGKEIQDLVGNLAEKAQDMGIEFEEADLFVVPDAGDDFNTVQFVLQPV